MALRRLRLISLRSVSVSLSNVHAGRIRILSTGRSRSRCYYSSATRTTGLGLYENELNSQSQQPGLSGSGTSVNPKDVDFDFIIAGGGLIGTILAVVLATTKRLESKKILLLETANKVFAKEPDGESDKDKSSDFSNRVFAISPGSRKVLQKFGIWDHIWRFQPVTSLQVWDALSDASISFDNPDFHTPVSYIIENPVLTYAVSKALEKCQGNVRIEYGSFVKSCKIPPASDQNAPAVVELKDGRLLTTKVVIGADGYNSRVRSAISSNYISFNYHRTAVVATLKLTEPTENNVAWQRFLPTDGPIALLPLSSNYSSLVWSTTPTKAKEYTDMPADAFIDSVNSALWQTYSKSSLVEKSCNLLSSMNLAVKGPKMLPPSISEVIDGSRATFPLGFGHSSYYVNRRAVVIGDAAHRVHPLAGQGLNLGIGDVDCLQRVLDKSVGLGNDFGLLSVLHEYESERQRHNVAIQTGIDFLHRLYSFELSPVVALRTLGLSLVNSSDMLKKFIISQAAA